MAATLHIRVHGRGNAWPVFLGQTHPFYDHTGYRDLANASYSLVTRDSGRVTGDVLIDAGHGTLQSLITGENRIPHAICLTHGHLDHTLGVDWVVQSHRRTLSEPETYPLHATPQVYRLLMQAYPQLEGQLDFAPLLPGKTSGLRTPGTIWVTSFPVFHGTGALGASMLLFETAGRRVLFTGDLITPLLRKEDYEQLRQVDLMVVDSNNRFPWPRSNHWSFAGDPDQPMERSDVLRTWVQESSPSGWTAPHRDEQADPQTGEYLDRVEREWDPETQPFTVLEFTRRILPAKVVIVHYSGTEDKKHYNQPVLSSAALKEWTGSVASASGVKSQFLIPGPGQSIRV